MILIAFFGVTLNSFSQVAFKPGFRAGLNVSNLTESYYTTKTSFYAGVVGEIKFKNFYSLQPEVGYSSQGAKGDVIQVGGNATKVADQIDLNYLTIGLINKFTFAETFSVLVGASLDHELNPSPFSRVERDLAFVFGLGFNTKVGLSFEARLKSGALDIIDSRDYKTKEGNNWLFLSSKNSNIVGQFGLVYLIPSKNNK